jgi:hypothetical protein
VPVVYILKDPSGMLRVQVPVQKEPGAPTVTRKGTGGKSCILFSWMMHRSSSIILCT